jgi:pilus assembly protein TadC
MLPHRRNIREAPLALIICATFIGFVSFTLHLLVGALMKGSLSADLVAGYGSLTLGFLSMYLCFKAWRASRRRWLVLLYSVMLAPFAFSLPAWLAFIWVMHATGRYSGPMP